MGVTAGVQMVSAWLGNDGCDFVLLNDGCDFVKFVQ